MVTRKLMVTLLAVVLVGMIASTVTAKGPYRYAHQTNPDCPAAIIELVPITEQEASDLLYMREEEKLARDVYLAMAELWEAGPFAKIAVAEQRHMDAVGTLITRYELVDPIVDDTPGVFTDPDLAALYTELVMAGTTSYVDALMVGAMIEEMDIVDLRDALAAVLVDHLDLVRVYENLLRGSRNHLRSFAWFIDSEGAMYEAQYLTQEEFDEIAASPMETGYAQRNRMGRGEGNGQGGNGNGGHGHGPGDGTGQGGNGTCDGTCDGTGQGGNGDGTGQGGNGNGDGTCING